MDNHSEKFALLDIFCEIDEFFSLKFCSIKIAQKGKSCSKVAERNRDRLNPGHPISQSSRSCRSSQPSHSSRSVQSFQSNLSSRSSQPRSQVFSPTSRSVGTGRREPWERGWVIPIVSILPVVPGHPSHFWLTQIPRRILHNQLKSWPNCHIR